MMNHAKQTLNYSIHTIELRRCIPLQALGEWKSKLHTLAAQQKERTYPNSGNKQIFYPYIHQGVIISLCTAQTCDKRAQQRHPDVDAVGHQDDADSAARIRSLSSFTRTDSP